MNTSPVNRLILDDNLEILKGMNGETVDLIYLDPPFFSNRNYEVIWGDAGEKRSFEDRWEGGIDHYIAWLKERVEHMHRVLKPMGSLFLHFNCRSTLRAIYDEVELPASYQMPPEGAAPEEQKKAVMEYTGQFFSDTNNMLYA